MRSERDALGPVSIPEDAYYGPSTARAVTNFPISGIPMHWKLIKNLCLIKKYAGEYHSLSSPEGDRIYLEISRACDRILSGDLMDQFPVDIFQTGSGTSTNMNINEVISGLANEAIGGSINNKSPVHPNDHVNKGQSSNDIVPSGILISSAEMLREELIPALILLKESFKKKETEFSSVKKIGRTHLQDALPISLGCEFGAYARLCDLSIERLSSAMNRLTELPLGGTAVGDGTGGSRELTGFILKEISRELQIEFREASDHYQAQSSIDSLVELSGILKGVALSLHKAANDIRWMASGPRCGLGEISLPELQPGSSIMPGKINPVICESVLQVAAKITGNDATIAFCAAGGHFQLNTMLPLACHAILESIQILARVSGVFAEKCIQGITLNKDRIRENLSRSLALATLLVPYIGYDRASEISKYAYSEGITIYEASLRKKILPQEKLEEIFKIW